jgi:hypothetical protein
MGAIFPSDSWMKELQRICNEDQEFKEACGNFSAKMIYQIDEEHGKLDETTFLFFWPHQGEIKEAMALSSPSDRPDTEFIILGKYSVWKAVLEGKQEPFRAIMVRRLKLVKGRQLTLLKQVKLSLRVLHNCTLIDSDFVDEIAG